MTAPRTVVCPHCGHPRDTKAAPRMRLRCPSCGKAYRAPDVEPDDGTPPAAAAPAPAPTPATEGAAAGGVQVERVAPVVAGPAPDPEPEGEPDPAEPSGLSDAARRQRKAQEAGRRGGRTTVSSWERGRAR